jgi:3-oxoadipate enol-lactonase
VRLTINGAALAVRTEGAGDLALVFLHYFGGSSRAWSGVVGRLVAEYRCVAPDLRGFGDSEAPATGYTIRDSADDIAALVHALALTRYVLVGHSMGGKIALAFAARRPPGLRSLVLIAPSPPTPEPMPESEREHLLASYGARAAAEETARKITARALTAPARAEIVADTLRSSRPAWVSWLERGSREDITALMPSVSVPLLVVASDSDPVLPARLLEREIVRRIIGARIAVLENVGHLMPIEAPEAIAAMIRESLHENHAALYTKNTV